MLSLGKGQGGIVKSIVATLLFMLTQVGLSQEEGFLPQINPPDVINWQVVGAQAEGDAQVRVLLRLTTKDGFSLYRDKITFTPSLDYALLEKKEPPAVEVVDPISNEKVKTFAGGEFELLFKGASKNGFMPLAITYIGCTDKICLFPYTVNLNLKVYPAIGQPPATADTEMGVSNPLRTASQPPVLGTEATEVEQILVDYAGQSKRSFLWLIIIALIGGILTNFTPCVLPMIPITLKTLGNQHARPVVSALVYGVGIITSYSALGMIVATTGGLFGAILGNTWFTLTFSCIMFVFGLTMLGWGNLAFLQRLGVKLSTTKASLPNAFCLGLGAGLVAAPCTGPILGALLAYSATQLVGLEAFALFFVYSLGFAIPYMFAGNFVVRIARVNIAPRMQIGVKLLLAGLMFGLFFYYLRIPFYQHLKPLRDAWFELSAIFTASGLLVAGFAVWRTHLAQRRDLPLLCALILGFGLFSFSQGATTSSRPAQVAWITSEAEALRKSEASQHPILIDAWAEWCERCKQMDAFTYTDPRLGAYLRKEGWVALKLDFTSTVNSDKELRRKYNIMSLPATVLVSPPSSPGKKVNINGFLSAETLLKHLRAFKVGETADHSVQAQ